jgi:hypothetical protein
MHGTLSRNFAAAESGEDIARYLFIENTALCRADAAFIFGNRHILGQSSLEAYRLYKDGYVDRIIVSGGKEAGEGFKEADILHHKLLTLGVPHDKILKEAESTNTQENICFSKKLAEDLGWNIQSLIGIGHIKAGRRFLMTLKQNWPEVFAMASNINPYGVAVEDWETHPRFKSDGLAQMARIRPYLEAGYIAEVDIAAINREVRQRRQASPGQRWARHEPA